MKRLLTIIAALLLSMSMVAASVNQETKCGTGGALWNDNHDCNGKSGKRTECSS